MKHIHEYLDASACGKVVAPDDGDFLFSHAAMNERAHPDGPTADFTFTAMVNVGLADGADSDDGGVHLVVGRAYLAFEFALACDELGTPLNGARPRIVGYTTLSDDDLRLIDDPSLCASDVEALYVYSVTECVRHGNEQLLRDAETGLPRYFLLETGFTLFRTVSGS